MTSHLLQITIGPIQDFILQARRTRDLWYGSHLLSELSRTVARSLSEQTGVVLIFPALGQPHDRAGELDPCIRPFRTTSQPGTPQVAPLAVANIILATVQGDVEKHATVARDGLQSFWREKIAAPIKLDCAGLLANDIDALWNEQIDTAIEFIAAWTPLAGDADYKAARGRIAKAIGARKNLRDFEPWTEQCSGLPKSSLDGARQTVLRPPKGKGKGEPERRSALVKKYRLNDGEQLDAVGLVKRTGGHDSQSRQNETSHDLQFVPIPNIAAAPWMALAKNAARDRWDIAVGASRALGMPRVQRGIPCGEPLFDRDASIFYRNRWWPEFKDLELLSERATGANEHLKLEKWQRVVACWGKDNVGPLLARFGEPTPYVACLVADGDGMGKAIDAIDTWQDHRKFSAKLSEFADAARTIVESNRHLGSLVYAGGDDVLAFLPVATAAAAADALRKSFSGLMATANLPSNAGQPTLSVGIGIGHMLESMSDLLDLGRAAEKAAKAAHLKPQSRDRNALAIILDKRSGGQRMWRTQWSEWQCDPVKRMANDVELLKKRLSMRKVYQVAGMLRRMPRPSQDADHQHVNVLVAETRRILARTEGAALRPEDVGIRTKNLGGYQEAHAEIADWVNRLVIARTMGEAMPQDRRAPSANQQEGAAV